jgi:hypothetical protein
MLNLLLGSAILAATGFLFWSARPVDGKMRAWITPMLEPYIAVGFVAAAGCGLGLSLLGLVLIFG